MRLGDRVRILKLGLLGAVAPGALLLVLLWATGRASPWWALPFGLASGLVTTWAMTTFFGVTQLERLAARTVHGGRHYYFGHDELRVVFDDGGRAWMRLEDVRRVAGGDPRGIRHFGPEESTTIEGGGRHAYLSVTGVRRYLNTSRHPDRQKFLLWFERDFVAPNEKRRERNLPLHSTGGGRI
jgi:hypothetical protein